MVFPFGWGVAAHRAGFRSGGHLAWLHGLFLCKLQAQHCAHYNDACEEK
jgi:hypothetical protein